MVVDGGRAADVRAGEDRPDGVGAIAPEVALGYGQVRRAINTDGAVSAAHKALLVAAGAVARGYPELAARELARGRDIGLQEAEVGAAAVAFLLMRGEGACDRFVSVAGALAPPDTPRPASDQTARDYFTSYSATPELPRRMALMAEHAPEVFAGYHRMHHGALVADERYALLSELVMITVNAAELATPFVAIHASTARRAGASDAEMVEAVVCAFPSAGVAAWAASAEAIFPPVG